MTKDVWNIIEKVRSKKPLVHAITNYVTVNDCANILLSFGASPAMCEAKDEVEDFVALADSLYINIGTLTGEQKEAIFLAVKKASKLNKPVVIDPVGVGALVQRKEFILDLLKEFKISILKGNLGEIKTLAGMDARVKGVDSIDDGSDGIDACKILANKYNTVVAATGETDIITDGQRVALIKNGNPMLTLVTGAGCMIGALSAATAAVEKDFYKAAAASVLSMGLTGELAAEEMVGSPLPGSYKVKLFDSIYSLTEEKILKRSKIIWE
ncbi:MAG: hydroxyethylthiazole kinase [Thermosediminibacterales bacterium]|nr:hydroxyethylthiazole kinase [Thermosediminibacterales bacterium]MDK2835923.1 hydroxyethylthiazole kinase [Thermosediminibacterales bacterium]